MSTIRFVCMAAVLALGGVACHPRPPASAVSAAAPSPSAVPARPPAPPPPPPPAVGNPQATLSEAELFRRKSLADLNAEHPLGDAFFDYNENVLRDDAKQALQRDARWLAKWPDTRIQIDGHCDERGTPEYNLALGERRAEIVKVYLTGLGISPDRMHIRSLGKEAPFCRDEGESCWSQNRRGHFLITGK